MKWNSIKEFRPHDHHYDEDNPARFVDCLVKTKSGSICTMRYDQNSATEDRPGLWYCGAEPYIYTEIDPVEYWQYLDEVDGYLTHGYDSSWCWEFGSTLADVAVPALTKWIDNGVSYVYGMTPEEWKEILKKIRDSFAEAKKILDGEYDHLSANDREFIIDEAEKKRNVAFSLSCFTVRTIFVYHS